MKEFRLQNCIQKEITSPENTELFIKEVGDALYLATLISYAQGLALLVKASKEYDFQIPLQDVVKSGEAAVSSDQYY